MAASRPSRRRSSRAGVPTTSESVFCPGHRHDALTVSADETTVDGSAIDSLPARPSLVACPDTLCGAETGSGSGVVWSDSVLRRGAGSDPHLARSLRALFALGLRERRDRS